MTGQEKCLEYHDRNNRYRINTTGTVFNSLVNKEVSISGSQISFCNIRDSKEMQFYVIIKLQEKYMTAKKHYMIFDDLDKSFEYNL